MEIKKMVTLIAVVLAAATGGRGQKFVPVERDQLKGILEEIGRVSKQIETMECSFIQYKTISVLAETAKSEGKMYYRKADRMRWEYTRPEAYYFVINGGKSVVKKNGETDRGGSARIFGEISKMILACISGQRLVDEDKFIPEYTMSGDLFRISLTPRNHRMQQMINALVMEFGMKEHAIRSVEMKQGEDLTRIEFKNKKVNGAIADELFKL